MSKGWRPWAIGFAIVVLALQVIVHRMDRATPRGGGSPHPDSAYREPPDPEPPPAAPPARALDPARTRAVAFIMDTSGSMATPLDGKRRIDAAKDALLRSLDLYKRHDDEAHDLAAGLWCFGVNDLRNPLPMAPFSYDRLHHAVSNLDSPGGVTPFGTRIGTAIEAAARALSRTPAASRAIVFLTDGENTAGPAPEEAYGKIRAKDGKPIDLYLVAFTVDRKHFAGLEALGAHVEEAKDSASLTRVFSDYSKLILEEPEPPEPAAPSEK